MLRGRDTGALNDIVMRRVWAASISAQVLSQIRESRRYLLHSLRVRIADWLNYFIGIVDYKKNKKEEAPKKRVNQRGVLKVDGYSDFNPEVNV